MRHRATEARVWCDALLFSTTSFAIMSFGGSPFLCMRSMAETSCADMCHLGGSLGPTKRVAHYLFCGRSVSRWVRLNRCTPWGCRLRMVMRASGGGNFGWIHALHAVLPCPRGAPCLGPTARRKGPEGARVARAELARPSSRPLSGPLSRPLLFAHCPLSGPLSCPLLFSNAPLSAH